MSPAPYEPRSTSLAAEGSPNREPEPYRDAISEEPEGEVRVRTEISPMREESSEVEEQTEDAEAGDQTTPEMQMDSEEETMEEQTLSRQIFGVSPDFIQISMRAMMRARLEMNQLQRHTEIAHQSGDARLIAQLQRAMENVEPFMNAEWKEVIFDLSGCKFNVSGFHLFRKHKDRNISIYSTCNFIPLPRDFNEVSGVYT